MCVFVSPAVYIFLCAQYLQSKFLSDVCVCVCVRYLCVLLPVERKGVWLQLMMASLAGVVSNTAPTWLTDHFIHRQCVRVCYSSVWLLSCLLELKTHWSLVQPFNPNNMNIVLLHQLERLHVWIFQGFSPNKKIKVRISEGYRRETKTVVLQASWRALLSSSLDLGFTFKW